MITNIKNDETEEEESVEITSVSYVDNGSEVQFTGELSSNGYVYCMTL